MELRNYNVYFFFAVLIGVTVLVYFVFKPFLVAFIIAAILAHLFGPVYEWLKKKTNKKGLSSGITCLIIALIIIIPIYFIFYLVINEAHSLLRYLSSENNELEGIVGRTIDNVSSISFLEPLHIKNLLSQEEIIGSLKSLTKNTVGIMQGAYQGISHLIFVVFVMFFSLFYLLIDGKKLAKLVMKMSPMKDKYEKIIITKFNGIIKGIIKGNIFIAIIQGILTGILFWSTGVSSPAILGILAGFASLVPTLGTGLVWVPVGVTMIFIGFPIQGMIILIVGALVISMIDNVIFPRIMKKDMELHPVLILFATLGGIIVWGVSGIVVGPIVVALFVVLWDIYMLEFKKQINEFNS